jgi:hypothetical protein
MPITENHRDLFVHAVTPGRLDLFQSLLDTKELTFDEALSLLSAVHVELEKPKAQPSSMYIRYAETIETFHQQMPEIHDQVVDAWRARRGVVAFKANSVQGFLGSQAKAGLGSTEESAEELVEEGKVEEEPVKSAHDEVHLAESKEEAGEAEGGEEEEHEEPEEESEEKENEEGDDEEVEEEPKEENGEGEEKEEDEESEKESEEEEKEDGDEEQEEKEEEEEGKEEQEEENESETGEESEVEVEEAAESGEAEAESEAEADHMATEAAEAAAEAEHVEVEMEEGESPGEEEAPMEGGE